MTDNDNRIQLPPGLIDFLNVIGITGQAHDNFPGPGQQPRYDWMRSFLIGLLSLQSSNDPPTQYRFGTLWCSKITKTINVWNGTAWVSLQEFIQIGTDSGGNTVTLAQHLQAITAQLESITPRMTFSGFSAANNVTTIPVPSQVQTALGSNPFGLVPVVYINGLLVDPRKSVFEPGCPAKISLLGGVKMSKNDRFTVVVERFDVAVVTDVVAA